MLQKINRIRTGQMNVKEQMGKVFRRTEITTFRKYYLETDGKHTVLIYGCTEPVLFSAEKMIFLCGEIYTEIIGEYLSIEYLSEDETKVYGNIKNIFFDMEIENS